MITANTILQRLVDRAIAVLPENDVAQLDGFVARNRHELGQELEEIIVLLRPASDGRQGWTIRADNVKGTTYYRVHGPFLGRDKFNALADLARTFDGFYVPKRGFSFKTNSQAEAFIEQAQSVSAGAVATPSEVPLYVWQVSFSVSRPDRPDLKVTTSTTAKARSEEQAVERARQQLQHAGWSVYDQVGVAARQHRVPARPERIFQATFRGVQDGRIVEGKHAVMASTEAEAISEVIRQLQAEGWVDPYFVAFIEPTKEPRPVDLRARADKLRASAEKLHQAAEQELVRDRLENTPKRAREAESVRARARNDQAIAASMVRIADAIEAGTAPHLVGITSRPQVEWLRGEIHRSQSFQDRERHKPITEDNIAVIKYPWPKIWPSHYWSSLQKLRETRGLKQFVNEWLRKLSYYGGEGAQDQAYTLSNPKDIASLEELAKKVEPHDEWFAKRIKSNIEEYQRAQRMGLDTPEKFQAALREFFDCCWGEARKESPIKKLEHELIGVNIPGYFPTPPDLADEIVARADLRPGMKVLEPSAGSGALAEAIRRAEPEVDLSVIERNSTLRDLLTAKGFNLIGRDFLEDVPEGMRFDAIIQNPPFEEDQDAEHVRRAYSLLKPGGVLVSIMGAGAFPQHGEPSSRRRREFREWLDSVGGIWEPNEEGAFLKSSRPTGVSSVTVVVHKPRSESMRRWRS